MNSLAAGHYSIRLAAGHRPFVGVDGGLTGPVRPIVTDAQYTHWQIEKVDDKFTFILPGPHDELLFVQESGADVIGDIRPPPCEWFITPAGDGTYLIKSSESQNRPIVWTVSDPAAPGSHVTLKVLEGDAANQRWTLDALD